jgi:membrane protein
MRLPRVLSSPRKLVQRAAKDDATGLAAEIALRSFLELFPFFVFLATLGDVLQNTLHIENPAREILDWLEESLPQVAADPIRQQLEAVLGSHQNGQIALPLLGVLWLAAGGGATLLKAMNRIYDVQETRPFWERYLVGLWLTMLGALVLVLSLLLMSAGQLLGQQTGGWYWSVASQLRWPLLLLMLLIEAAVVYRVAPNTRPAWSFITPGAALFAVGWLAASALFGIYIDKTGGYAQTYGVLGGVIVLLLWLQITALALLLGAELNDLLEHPSTKAPNEQH